MSARSHHRVTPGAPNRGSAYELGRTDARRERLAAREQGQVVRHLKIRQPEEWARQTAQYRKGYEAGWGSAL